jgi:hypothetical protein
VSATVLIGILISISGIYLSLSERSKEHKSGSAGGAARLVLPRFSITRSAAFQSLVFVGLAILGLAHSTSGELASWELAGTTVLASGLRSSIFFLGACLALAGSIGVVFALTARTVALSVAVLGTGAATVLGVSGNVIVSGFSLAVAAICGWWVHRQIRLPFADTFSTNNKSGGDAEIERALSDDRRSLPEPFLTSVAIVLFCWILGATLQTAVVDGHNSGNERFPAGVAESGVRSQRCAESKFQPRLRQYHFDRVSRCKCVIQGLVVLVCCRSACSSGWPWVFTF